MPRNPSLRRYTDEEMLALLCECGEPIYAEAPDGGFHVQSRVRPRARCLACTKKAIDAARYARMKKDDPIEQAHDALKIVGVRARTCGHQWISRVKLSSVIKSGEARMECPECGRERVVDLTGREDRICARCDKKLSVYNSGKLCFSCDDLEREQYYRLVSSGKIRS